jgi:hypothetical protein
MTIKPEKADDDIDALEALESEEKEYLKVSPALAPSLQSPQLTLRPPAGC